MLIENWNADQICSSAFYCNNLIIVEISENCKIDIDKIEIYFNTMKNKGGIMIPFSLSDGKIDLNRNSTEKTCNIAWYFHLLKFS